MKPNKLVIAFLVLTSLFANYSFAQPKYTRPTNPKTPLDYSISWPMFSNVEHRNFQISVFFPYTYSPTSSTKFPVVYLTDANVTFDLVCDMMYTIQGDLLGYGLPVPIIVGIGYDNLHDWDSLRWYDLSPVVDPDSTDHNRTGGGPQFLKFISTELIPTINSHYNSDPMKRSYTGYSYGGLFGLYAMFNYPEIFQNYIIGSPALYYANNITFNYFDTFKHKHPNFKGSLFMSVGSLEQTPTNTSGNMITNLQNLTTDLYNMHDPYLHLYSQELLNQSHNSGGSTAFSLGVRYICNDTTSWSYKYEMKGGDHRHHPPVKKH